MSGIEWVLQAVLLLLLLAALPFAWRLERQLSALRQDRPALQAGAEGFAEATRQAEAALVRLRATAEGAGRGVAERVAQAKPLREDLRFLVERAEALADRLERLVRDARPLASGAEPRHAAAPVPAAAGAEEAPRSQAERDLLRALRLAR
ncbi:DUF6468 domain-containing protein [Roseomonas sp. BN140053]|uniref:DUF6468 domain-containing protein n=1 Tax=Roseomonas sp. BN140053 TaxID=3391898 RepID=UPI0039EA8D0E